MGNQSIILQIIYTVSIQYTYTTRAQFESNYSFYYSNYSLIRISIVATIDLLEINGGSEHLVWFLPLTLSNKTGS